MTLIADAGGLYSDFDSAQPDHELFLHAVNNVRGSTIISPIALAELDYFIPDRLGREKQLTVLEEIENSYVIEPFSNEDLARARTLLAQYADLMGFGLADASCVVFAEKHGCFDILTTDQRDFRAVVGSRGRRFRILPYRWFVDFGGSVSLWPEAARFLVEPRRIHVLRRRDFGRFRHIHPISTNHRYSSFQKG